MPALLTWDTPALTWDSAFWDSTTGKKSKAMNTKAIINFSGYTATELGPIAQVIHDKMLLNAATFTTPPLTMAALQTLITTYDEKLVAKASRAKADTLAFNEARDELEDKLGSLGKYVNLVADGDPLIVEKSGFPSYATGAPPPPGALEPPTNLRLTQNLQPSGAVLARYKPARARSTNEVQVNLGDPNNEAAWQTKGMFASGRALLEDLPLGDVVWVRVRTIGPRNEAGDWSDPAQIRVV